jgi:ubiquinone/menaquinone biosynthesis C-methylase UbiE
MGQTEPKPFRQVGDETIESGRGIGQMGWYHYAANHLVRGKTVLDVGCGLAAGLDVISQFALEAKGQDLDPRLKRHDIIIGPIEDLPSNSFDVITCIDVIEHVEKDEEFVFQLGRIARETVFISTPNWTVSRCHWPYHVREYTPKQLRNMLSKIGHVSMLKGEPSGYEYWPADDRFYALMNDARNWPPTALATRVLSRILPAHLRLRAHQAAIVDVHR